MVCNEHPNKPKKREKEKGKFRKGEGENENGRGLFLVPKEQGSHTSTRGSRSPEGRRKKLREELQGGKKFKNSQKPGQRKEKTWHGLEKRKRTIKNAPGQGLARQDRTEGPSKRISKGVDQGENKSEILVK